jgi:hypothetical protein
LIEQNELGPRINLKTCFRAPVHTSGIGIRGRLHYGAMILKKHADLRISMPRLLPAV